MTQLIKDQPAAAETLRVLYAPIRRELDEVEDLLREELSSGHPFVDRLAKHGFRLGGKRLRPALVLLSAQACGKSVREHVVMAAVVELIHTATLIHDDVLDEATLRRHLETINARWDNEASVLLGDYLLARAIRMTSMLDGTFATRAIGETAQTMCEGELQQVASRGDFDLNEEDYLGIIGRKTAALTACCCRLGAHFARAEGDVSQALTQFGYDLGVAFQIVDDLLDLLGDEATVGKSLGTDLAKQKPTLPLIRVLGVVAGRERAELVTALSGSDNHHLEMLRPWFARFDAIAYARDKARDCVERACAELAVLPPSPAREALAGLAEFVLARQQ